MKPFTFGLAIVELILILGAILSEGQVRSGEERLCPALSAERMAASLAADCPATTVAISEDRRVFVAFPARNPRLDGALAEIGPDGSVRPYPDRGWNAWGLPSAMNDLKHFVRVQSLVSEGDSLWALDSGVADQQDEASSAAKLVRINLRTDRVDRVYAFRDDAAWRDARFTDLRIDPATDTAYITDEGAGGVVALDLLTGRAERTALDGESQRPHETISTSLPLHHRQR